MIRAILLIISVGLSFSETSYGQISQGGFPKDLPIFKSAKIETVKMPGINTFQLAKNAIGKLNDQNSLKSFTFAHAFDVNLNTDNSGNWYKTSDGYYCWKLNIHSEGAKSLNLIFDDFELPENARLFLFNKKENYYLGAFTSLNNKSSLKFAVSPVLGDEITIQYEVLSDKIPEKHFEIKSVNHDYVGILKYRDRRPLDEIAGECNIDVNCELGENWEEVKNAVCRLIVNGIEVCTGTLINNTAENQVPYILSAAHCYDRWEYAETSVYVFNYESPYCAPLDGDPSNSISGALMKAQFDSLDFALAELSVIPPPDFRPYFAGWDRSDNIQEPTSSIHHPQGDIKKISIDEDSPTISSFNGNYIDDAFLKISRWDHGVTEVGSSGGPLFDSNNNIVGTLTGGVATCSNPVRDYFSRFTIAWDYRADSAKQLKYWLDPLGKDLQTLDGIQFYVDEDYCAAFTNLNDDDEHDLVTLLNSEEFAGYWGGTNDVGITEIVEKFSLPGNPQLSGVSIGVGKIDIASSRENSEITIKVYDGNEKPESVVYSKNVLIEDLVEDAMNFIGFDEVVEPSETFFVGFDLSNMQAKDTFVVYQSLREANTDNFFYFKQDEVWQDFEEVNLGYNSIANVFELIACNVTDTIIDIPKVDDPLDILVYPNPADGIFTVESGSDITRNYVSVLNLIGQEVGAVIRKTDKRKVAVDMSGNAPGVYFVRYNNGKEYISKKISYIPW